jgi:hypothetical protein
MQWQKAAEGPSMVNLEEPRFDAAASLRALAWVDESSNWGQRKPSCGEQFRPAFSNLIIRYSLVQGSASGRRHGSKECRNSSKGSRQD